jgi:hypothetical protein
VLSLTTTYQPKGRITKVRKKMERTETHRNHNKKRTIIGISIYEKDQIAMINKFGKILNGTEAKSALLNNQIKIVHKTDNQEAKLLLVQLKRIGNNINQLAYQANVNNFKTIENNILLEFENLKVIIKKSEEFLYK